MRIRDRFRNATAVALFATVGFAAWCQADVKPHALFTNHCVLQQGAKVPVWGWADPGEKVTVEIDGQKVEAAADSQGAWTAILDKLKAGGPYTLTISGKNTVTLDDVLVGEVWLASGQSNMQWAVSQSDDVPNVIASAKNHPQVRLFTVPRTGAAEPQKDVAAAWAVTTPDTVPGFSAVAFAFGKMLNKELGVPIGLVSTNYGGTPAEAWTSREALMGVDSLKYYVDAADKTAKIDPAAQAAYEEALAKFRDEAAKAKKEGKPAPKAPQAPIGPTNPHRPSGLYNAMIAPLVPLAFKGAIWYQGESNANRAWEYQTLFPLMIQSWRDSFKQGEFPFLFVQLAPFMKKVDEPRESAWAELREAQRLTVHKSPNTGMAVITDLGDEKDIHPKWKEPVGVRLAAAALKIAYGKEIVHAGPEYKSVEFKDGKAVVSFENVGGGLAMKDGKSKKPEGFTIAGADGKFVNADATIQGDVVVVSSPKVT
ncbi:MAG: sialate O-acetylesterase, partial [Planctomycetia bacterium]